MEELKALKAELRTVRNERDALRRVIRILGRAPGLSKWEAVCSDGSVKGHGDSIAEVLRSAKMLVEAEAVEAALRGAP